MPVEGDVAGDGPDDSKNDEDGNDADQWSDDGADAPDDGGGPPGGSVVAAEHVVEQPRGLSDFEQLAREYMATCMVANRYYSYMSPDDDVDCYFQVLSLQVTPAGSMRMLS